jgi:hypothetical protein
MLRNTKTLLKHSSPANMQHKQQELPESTAPLSQTDFQLLSNDLYVPTTPTYSSETPQLPSPPSSFTESHDADPCSVPNTAQDNTPSFDSLEAFPLDPQTISLLVDENWPSIFPNGTNFPFMQGVKHPNFPGNFAWNMPVAPQTSCHNVTPHLPYGYRSGNIKSC